MNKLIILLLIMSIYTKNTYSAVLHVKNKSDKVIQVDRRNNVLSDAGKKKFATLITKYGVNALPVHEVLPLFEIKGSITLNPGQEDTFNSGVYGIYLLTFSEIDRSKIAPGKATGSFIKLVAFVNPDIEWSDIFSSVIYNNPQSINVYNSSSKSLRKAELAFEIIGGVLSLPLVIQPSWLLAYGLMHPY